MSIFCIKKLEKSDTVCHQLKKLRERKKISLETASKETMISIKYLTAIEECRFSDLPRTRAHRKAYIKKYGKFLGLNENNLSKKFDKEEGLDDIKNIQTQKINHVMKSESISIWLRNIVTGLFLLLFVIYALWQIQGILQPPRLFVYSPPEGFVTASMNIIVEGKTNKENRVSVNGEDLMVNNEGHFSGRIDLSKGINTINIIASKKHGKTTSITRNIIVK